MFGWKFPQYAMMTFTAMLLLAGCVSQKKYDTLDAEYQQLNQTMSAEVAANQMQITRLQNAIKLTVNSELLFPSGDWQMPVEAQQTIGKIVPILAPKQQTKIQVNGYTDNVPIGPGLMRQGITSNLELSQKAGRQREAVHDLAGSQPQPSVGAGFRRERPRGLERHAAGPGAEPARGTDAGWFGQLNQAVGRSGRAAVNLLLAPGNAMNAAVNGIKAWHLRHP